MRPITPNTRMECMAFMATVSGMYVMDAIHECPGRHRCGTCRGCHGFCLLAQNSLIADLRRRTGVHSTHGIHSVHGMKNNHDMQHICGTRDAHHIRDIP